MRSIPPAKDGYSPWAMYSNWGKKSLCLSLRKQEGRDIALELSKSCDVVVENFRPGVMKRLGLDYTDFQKVNPSIIMCSISGFGQYGPLKDSMCADRLVQAYSGMLDLTGEPDQTPVFFGTAIGDTCGGIHGWGSICAALFNREKTGLGHYIDISLVDSLFAQHEFAVGNEALGLERIHRFGHHHQTVAPAGIYRMGEKYIALSAAENITFVRLAELMDKPELANDPRFDTPAHRTTNVEELSREIEDWVQKFDDIRVVVDLLQSNRIMAAPLMTVPELMNDPHILARQMLVEIEHPTLGPMKVLNSPVRFSSPGACVQGLPPISIGEHTEEILTNLLHLDPQKLVELRERRIVYTKDDEQPQDSPD